MMEAIMSQLIACKTPHGLVFGADSKSVDVDASGNLIELKVERMHQLSEYTAIMNAGSAAGEQMCQALKQFIHEENLAYIDEIHQAALAFLSTEYEKFMRKTCEIQPIDPIHQVTFILGGYAGGQAAEPFRLYLLWTKRKLPLLDIDEIGTSFTVPRIIRLEHRLHQLASQKADLDKAVTEVRMGLEIRAERDDEVSAPLHFAVIQKNGFKWL
jgi:predicted proteasome-type protease